ncbi:MAG: large conductance mechanosensitive channel protein MscL [Candidatus Limnocylindrales bacterium]
MLSEFRTFLFKTNAMALAIGVIIGVALGTVVTSLVNDIIMPPIGLLLGGVDFDTLQVVLKEGTATSDPVAIRYGSFINAVITFVIVALVVFWISRRFMPREPDAAPTRLCPYCRELNSVEATRCKFCTSELTPEAA